jgi:hypothetical protein
MGIMVNFKSAINEYARANHVSVQSIDAKTMAEIRLEAVLKEGAKRYGVYEAAMTTAGKQMLSMVRYTENLQVRLGETFNPATTVVVMELVKSFKEASESMKAWQDSGGQATFANNLATGVATVIDWFKFLVGAIGEAETALKSIVGGFAMFKIVGWATEGSAAFSKWASSGINAFRATTMSRLQYAASAEVAAIAEQTAVNAEIAAQKGRFLTNELINKRTMANIRVAESNAVVTATTLQLTEAETLRGQASIMANQAMAAMGGPIGVALIAIAALIVLVREYRDVSVQAARDDVASAEKVIAKWREELAQWEELDRIRNKDQKKKKKEEIAIDNIPEVRKLINDLNAANKKMAETEAQAGSLKLALKDIWYGLTHFEDENNDTAGSAKQARDLARDELAKIRKEAEDYRKGQKEEEDRAKKAAADRKRQNEIEEASAERQLYFKKQMAAMNEKIQLAQAKTSSMNAMDLEINKVRLDTEKEITGWKAMNADHDKNGKTKLEWEKVLVLIFKARQAEAEMINAIEGTNDRKIYDEILADTEHLNKANADATKSTRELTMERMRAQNALLTGKSKLSEAELIEAVNNHMAAEVQNYKNLNDATEIYNISLAKLNALRREGALGAGDYERLKFGLDDAKSGGLMSANERPEEKYARDMEQLIARRSTMSLTTYERQLIKLKETSGSSWAAMGQVVKGYTDQTSTLLADYFNGTATNWHKMFASMVKDMEVAIIKATIMKPIMDGLAASISNMTKGGGMSMWAAFLQGSGWGGTAAPAASGNYSNVGSGLNTTGAGGFTGSLGSSVQNSGLSAAFKVAGGPSSTTKAAQPRGAGDVYLSVTVAPNGTAQTQESGSNEQSLAMARGLAAKMREVIMEEQRPNGIIYDFVAGR